MFLKIAGAHFEVIPSTSFEVVPSTSYKETIRTVLCQLELKLRKNLIFPYKRTGFFVIQIAITSVTKI